MSYCAQHASDPKEPGCSRKEFLTNPGPDAFKDTTTLPAQRPLAEPNQPQAQPPPASVGCPPAADPPADTVKGCIATYDWPVSFAIAVFTCESGLHQIGPQAEGDKVDGVATSVGVGQIHWTVHKQWDRWLLTYNYHYNLDAAHVLWAAAGNSFRRDWVNCSAKSGAP